MQDNQRLDRAVLAFLAGLLGDVEDAQCQSLAADFWVALLKDLPLQALQNNDATPPSWHGLAPHVNFVACLQLIAVSSNMKVNLARYWGHCCTA